MDKETLDRLCREALQRIKEHIYRSASQTIRRMKERWKQDGKSN